jgi:hypothetical protein
MRDAGIIDEEKKVRHTKLALKAAQVIAEPSKIGIKLKVLFGLTFWCFLVVMGCQWVTESAHDAG